jgi:outer membrane protein assembly factor BamB
MLLSVGRVGLWRFDGETLVPAWTIPTAAKPALLRFDPDRVLLLEPDDQGGTLLALDPADGHELWRAEHLGEALARAAGPAAVAGQERFDTPLDGEVAAGDLLLALDEATIAVVSRSGRVAGIDLATGRVAWARRGACQQVGDAAAGDGVLALGGTATAKTGDAAGEPIVCILDLASGEEISRYTPSLGPATGKVRWLHLEPGSRRVVVGFSRGIVGLALPEATPDWTLADPRIEQSTGAWTAGRRLFVQTSMRDLTLVVGDTGELLDPRLDTAGCLALDEPIDGVATDGRFVLLSPAGFAALDATTGVLLAADAIDPIAGMVQPALGRERLALLEREPIPGRQGLYRLHILDAVTGRAVSTTTLALTDRPRRVALLDGVVLITAGDSTVVVPTD